MQIAFCDEIDLDNYTIHVRMSAENYIFVQTNWPRPFNQSLKHR